MVKNKTSSRRGWRSLGAGGTDAVARDALDGHTQAEVPSFEASSPG